MLKRLPVKEGGRECVHWTLSQCKQDNYFILICLCVIYYTEYYQADLPST